MVDAAVRPSETPTAEPHIDAELVTRMLLGTWADTRREAREMIKDPAFWQINGLSMQEHRERVLSQLHLLVDAGGSRRAFPKKYGGLEDNGANLAGFEELVLADPSLQIKSGVQWGLFGSAIYQLGTEKHHDKWLPGVISLDLPGAFAMTETGHGSDVSAIGTTATYDPETEEFVIHTPFRGAWKDYLGNAALHGKAATVFAQLITGGVNYGVHCFFVPIRDDEGTFLPGVGGEDDGVKGGLNGIDNGRLHFDQVRIPRENLLNRYGDVAPDGTYSSPIDSPGRRFFTMLGALVQGRVSLDGASTWASALALTIAVTYGNQRRQFDNGAGTPEVTLLDYGKHQRRLLPRLAQVYAQAFAHDELLQMFDGVFSGRTDTPDEREDLETLAAALKALSTWNALDTIQEAREACGGQGFLAENRLTALRADLDIYVTFEGDNNVLLQLVGKRLLSDYAKQFKGKDAASLARFAVGQTAGNVVHGAGLRQFGQVVTDFGSTARAVERGLRGDQQHELLGDRVQQMVSDIAGRLRPASKMSKTDAAALFNENQAELIEAGRAHGELLQWEAFTDAVNRIEDADTKQVLTWLRDLFGLTLIEKHLSWYLINGRLSNQRAAAVTRYIDRLLRRLRPHAQELVDAFGYEPEHVRAPIASGAEQARQDEAADYYARQAADGSAPIPEKVAKSGR
ncbi:MAG: acyl-CoA dehydrogenase [Actinobacteria bacterium]|uniref:acyl-CoA dehydrogenase family protein n=1 Tax=Microbacterium TaxID=33882 RepID=UPI000E9B7123|nr:MULTISPECIES: acyl-CoA dehydrogenase [Microbacterium]RUA27449.1 MAG: acyl-CoA dehydrogenase [Actinomycetota bacterium]HAJ18424.1 acyl-CoA dehydrogenase [Microbacterium sp.]MCC4268833.1 acyl-CoA dehydrogenase family protein [Microbacterium schleiferi]HBU42668.1 acyl-CoA dehydrogenase [Microbacterium sp.]HCM49509.1 acyl-CoA dehydrogenase [Microbacterium sp.]|tara:strand:- start:1103 stop:3154 length:2052 start_codon:yes stop_codon:yes gene_type:complete